MAFDEHLAQRIRDLIGNHPALTEKKMFGGLAFLIAGNMAVGVHHDELMVRVGKDAHDDTVALPGARTFDLSSKPMRGWIVVAPHGFNNDATLEQWIQRGRHHAETLPPRVAPRPAGRFVGYVDRSSHPSESEAAPMTTVHSFCRLCIAMCGLTRPGQQSRRSAEGSSTYRKFCGAVGLSGSRRGSRRGTTER